MHCTLLKSHWDLFISNCSVAISISSLFLFFHNGSGKNKKYLIDKVCIINGSGEGASLI